MRSFSLAGFVSGLISTTQAGNFNHGRVYRINRDPRIETETWKSLGDYIELQMGNHINIWNANRQFIDVQVPEQMSEIYEKFMEGFDIEPKLMVEDVEVLIKNTMVRKTEGFDYQQYNTLDDIYQWMANMASQYEYITIENYGSSYEGRQQL